MRKWSVLFVCVTLVLAAATVFAVQNYSALTEKRSDVSSVKDEISPQAYDAAAAGSGCGGAGGCSVSGASGCGSGASGGCGAPADPAVARQRVESIQSYLYAYFSKAFNDPAISVEVDDFGCHQEASVLKDGKIIKRLSISGNTISEIRS